MFSAAKLPKKAKNRFPAVNFFPSGSAAVRFRRSGFGGDARLRRRGLRRTGFGTAQAPATMRGSGGAGFGDSVSAARFRGWYRLRRRCGTPAVLVRPGLNLRVQSYADPARCRCRSRFRKLSRTKTKHPGNLPGCLCPCCRQLFRTAGAACSVVPYLAARMLFSA